MIDHSRSVESSELIFSLFFFLFHPEQIYNPISDCCPNRLVPFWVKRRRCTVKLPAVNRNLMSRGVEMDSPSPGMMN